MELSFLDPHEDSCKDLHSNKDSHKENIQAQSISSRAAHSQGGSVGRPRGPTALGLGVFFLFMFAQVTGHS